MDKASKNQVLSLSHPPSLELNFKSATRMLSNSFIRSFIPWIYSFAIVIEVMNYFQALYVPDEIFSGIIEGSECKRNYEGCSCSEGYPGERATSICKKSGSCGSLYSGILRLLLAVY